MMRRDRPLFATFCEQLTNLLLPVPGHLGLPSRSMPSGTALGFGLRGVLFQELHVAGEGFQPPSFCCLFSPR